MRKKGKEEDHVKRNRERERWREVWSDKTEEDGSLQMILLLFKQCLKGFLKEHKKMTSLNVTIGREFQSLELVNPEYFRLLSFLFENEN